MSKKSLPAASYRAFFNEIDSLRNEGILSDETAEQIAERYEPLPEKQRDWGRLFFLTLSTLAVIMLGCAAFLLISFNWKFLAPVYKTEIVFGAFFCVYALALFFRRGQETLSELFFLGGAILYGVAIWQIGQIFNIDAHYPRGIWLWAVGVWLLAFLVRYATLHLFAAALLTLWGGVEVTQFPDFGLFFFGRSFTAIPNAAWTLLIMSGLGVWYGWRTNRAVISTFYLLSLLLWGLFQTCWIKSDLFGAYFLLVWFGLFVLFGYFAPKARLSHLLLPTLFGWAGFLITLQVLCFYELNSHLWKCAGAAVGATILFNLASLAISLWLLRRRGSFRGAGFIAGVANILLWALLRYFDLFGNFGGMLGAAGFFVLMAAALFAAAWFWRHTKNQVPADETEPAPPAGVLAAENGSGPFFRGEPLLGEPRSRTLILAVILFQTLVLGGMIYSRTVPFRNAEQITVETEPVDPRDLFRGDYVILNYSFTNPGGFRGFGNNQEKIFDSDVDPSDRRLSGRTVYTLMEIGADQIARPTKMTLQRPESGIFLKGIWRSYYRVNYGIHSFYVQEGTGRDIERAMSRPNEPNPPKLRKKVLVDLLVAPSGDAKIKAVRIVDVPPEEKPEASPKTKSKEKEEKSDESSENAPEAKPASLQKSGERAETTVLRPVSDEKVSENPPTLFPRPEGAESITPADFAPINRPAMKWSQDGVFAKDPSVIRFAGKYRMYYSYFVAAQGGKKMLTIGVAESGDLTDWRFVKNILPMQECDRNGLGAPCAKVIDGKVWLFYQTYGNGPHDAICCASSGNGLDFTPHPENPIFRPTGDWNSGRAIDADLIEFQGKLFLYAATRDPAGKRQMLVAASADPKDGFGPKTWTQAADRSILAPELPWETGCIEAPSVLEKDGRLYMFYAGGFNNDPQHIGLAVSGDGIHWTRCWDVPFITNGPAGSWNASESGHPGVFVDDDGSTWLFYQGNATYGKDWFLSRVRLGWRNNDDGFALPFVEK